MPKVTQQNLPKGWQKKQLGDLGRVSMCKRILKSQTSETGDIPFFKIGTFGKEPDAYITKEVYEDFKTKYSFPKIGDILISASGTIGRTVVYDGSPSYYQDSNIIWIANDEDLVVNTYLNYLYEKVRWQTASGTIARLYNDNVRRVEISTPEITEQNRIVKVLETWDEAIEKLDRIIKLKKSVKKGLMQKLLTGELRLPGFKDEWQETLLNEVVTFAKGNVLSKADLDSEGKYECIHYGELFTKYGEVITSVISRTNKDVKVSKSESGDVLMPTSDVTPRGLATASCINKKGVVIGGDTLVLRPKKNIDGNFLSFYINSHKKDVMKLVSGTTVFHLYGSGMKKMKIKYPTDVEEQKQIAEVIISVNKQIKTLEKKMSYFQEQKKHLLNNLVTGQIRTPENL